MKWKKQCASAAIIDDSRVVTPWAQIVWPALFEPAPSFDGGEAKYGGTLIFDPEEVDVTAMKELLRKTAKAKWGNNLPKNLKLPFRDGEEKSQECFEGKVFINAQSKFAPGVYAASKAEIIDPAEIYGGCYVRATLTAYTWEFMGKKGVSFSIQNVQKLADGEGIVSAARGSVDDFGDALETETPSNPTGEQPGSNDSFADDDLFS